MVWTLKDDVPNMKEFWFFRCSNGLVDMCFSILSRPVFNFDGRRYMLWAGAQKNLGSFQVLQYLIVGEIYLGLLE